MQIWKFCTTNVTPTEKWCKVNKSKYHPKLVQRIFDLLQWYDNHYTFTQQNSCCDMMSRTVTVEHSLICMTFTT